MYGVQLLDRRNSEELTNMLLGMSRGDWNKMAKARDENVRVAALKLK